MSDLDKEISTNQSVFNFGQLAAIAACAFLLIGLAVFKNGLSLPIFKRGPEATVKEKYTYEQARQQVLADSQAQDQATENLKRDEISRQLAMLDPSFNTGSVLGVSTGTLEALNLPKLEDFVTQEELQQIPVQEISETNIETITQYLEALSDADLQNNIVYIISNLGTDNQEALLSVPATAEELITRMYLIKVPKALVLYHKLTMLYYVELGELAANYAGVEGSQSAEITSMQIFSLMRSLQEIREDISKQYNVEL